MLEERGDFHLVHNRNANYRRSKSILAKARCPLESFYVHSPKRIRQTPS